jgi:hypothetical protein
MWLTRDRHPALAESQAPSFRPTTRPHIHRRASERVPVTTPPVSLAGLRLRDAREPAIALVPGLLADDLVTLTAVAGRVLATEQGLVPYSRDQACGRRSGEEHG